MGANGEQELIFSLFKFQIHDLLNFDLQSRKRQNKSISFSHQYHIIRGNLSYIPLLQIERIQSIHENGKRSIIQLTQLRMKRLLWAQEEKNKFKSAPPKN